jgi:hypothetical protein
MSDLRLDEVDGTWVVVDANVLKVTATDFLLDSPLRHRTDRPGLRRAMVHDQQDGLTINFHRDYPGGVTINDLHGLNNPRSGMTFSNVREIHAFGKLVVRGEMLIEKSPSGNPFQSEAHSERGEERKVEMISLQAALLDLQGQVSKLTERLARLEGVSKY